MTILVKCNKCGKVEIADYSDSEGYEEPLNWVENGVHEHLCKSCVEKLSSNKNMAKYRFEIQNCIEKEIEADTKEEARMELVCNPELYQEELCGIDCYISDGEEVDK